MGVEEIWGVVACFIRPQCSPLFHTTPNIDCYIIYNILYKHAAFEVYLFSTCTGCREIKFSFTDTVMMSWVCICIGNYVFLRASLPPVWNHQSLTKWNMFHRYQVTLHQDMTLLQKCPVMVCSHDTSSLGLQVLSKQGYINHWYLWVAPLFGILNDNDSLWNVVCVVTSNKA